MQDISKETLQRLPKYFRYLKELSLKGVENVSSSNIAEKFGYNAVSVRKDLAAASKSNGRPKTGFAIKDLIEEISNLLGYNNTHDAVLVGVGRLGNALVGYKGFENYGLNIVATFDNNIEKNKYDCLGREIFHISQFESIVKQMGIKMGIITVPATNAQDVCELMVKSGIKAIWNFSPTHLVVSSDIAIKNEDMAASLAVLSRKLTEKLQQEINEKNNNL